MILGAQTYTIRQHTQTAADFDASMAKIAQIGYTQVQLSAVGPIPAEELRSICDRHGLQIVLTHTSPDRILHETEAVIREHDILGCKYVGIGAMPKEYRTGETVTQFAQDFTLPARKLRDAGKLLMYHNHNFEWERISGKTKLIDVLLETMPAELMGVTLDTYWVQAAGADIMTWIELLRDRIPCVHLKDMTVCGMQSRFAPVGEGNIDFPRILARLAEIGKTEHILVEQDDGYGADMFECLRTSYMNVKEMGY